MLLPDERQSLPDALRPPEGYELGCVVGTSFSLNLESALAVPAAYARSNVADCGARDDLEPLALIEALQRTSGKITIFFQAGQASVPSRHRSVLEFLDEVLVPVSAPVAGVFHPKVWVMRFDKPHSPSSFRFLCASRNLTYDRSWDTVLRLDSMPPALGRSKAEKSVFDNRGLSSFIRSLPELAKHPLEEDRSHEILELAAQLDSVEWAAPKGVSSGRFVPIGISEQATLPFPKRVDRMAVVSPFLSTGLLDRLPEAKQERILVSRPDQISACSASVNAAFSEVLTLDPDARFSDGDQAEDSNLGHRSPQDPEIPFDGLHAKLFVFDQGSNSTVWTGSANATTAAFSSNVEFMTEMTGPKNQFGVHKLLSESTPGAQTLRKFLVSFDPDKDGDEPDDDSEIGRRLDDLRMTIAAIELEARVTEAVEGTHFDLFFNSLDPMPDLPSNAAWKCWPISVPEATAKELRGGARLDVNCRVDRFESITSFLANELTLDGETTRFVLTANRIEWPQDRNQRLVKSLIGDPQRLFEYIVMNLVDDSRLIETKPEIPPSRHKAAARSSTPAYQSLPLLEELLRSLAESPEQLGHIEDLIDSFESESDGSSQLPSEFLAIWNPIAAACKEYSK